MSPPGSCAVPRWLDRLVVLSAGAVTALLLAGVPLALGGVFRPVPVALAAGAVFAVLVVPLLRVVPAAPRPRRVVLPAALAGAVAAAYTIWTALHTGQHLLVDGDPAVYAMTGEQLAAHGTPYVDLHPGIFGGFAHLDALGDGFFRSGSVAYPQFFHGLGVLLAVGRWIGGQALLLRVDALLAGLALLAIYAVAARLAGPWWGLAAVTAQALLLPQLWFARETFSELPSELLVWAALLVLWWLVAQPAAPEAPLRAVVGGLLFGASTVVRIDAFSYLVWLGGALLLLCAFRRLGWRCAALAGVGALVPVVVAVADAKVGTPTYLASVRGQLLLLAFALVVVVAAGVVLARVPSLLAAVQRLGARWARPLGIAGVVVVLAGTAYGWGLRPLVEVSRDIPAYTNATIAGLQRSEGVPVQVPRAYDEMTLHWLAWYVGGVTLAVACLAVAWLLWRVLRGRAPAAVPLLALVALSTAVYAWRPQVFPVQYWASRRFLPVTFPGLVVLAAWAGSRLWAARGRASSLRARRGLAAASLVVLGGLVLWPAAALPSGELVRGYYGTLPVIRNTCASLTAGDAVVLVGGGPVAGLLEPLRIMCGVPAVTTTGQTTRADVARAVAAIRASGHRPVLLSGVPDPSVSDGRVGSGLHFGLVADRTVPTAALALTHRPDRVYPLRIRVYKATP